MVSEPSHALVLEENILEVSQGISAIVRDALDDFDERNDVRVKEPEAFVGRGRGLNESQRNVPVQNLVAYPGPFQDFRCS